MEGKIKQKFVVFSILALSAAVAIGFVTGSAAEGAFGNGESSPIAKNADVAKAWDVQKAFRAIYDLYDDRVVYITTEQTVKVPANPYFFFFDDPNLAPFGKKGQGDRTQKRKGLGTGFIISSDGYIATNNHVVDKAEKVTVKIGTKEYKADVIGTDERTDIALLKINASQKFKPVYLGNSDEVNVGDWSIAIGNPYGLEKTFTVGVISATGRKNPEMMGGNQPLIQTDASINRGNSGGPLINIKGEVIGINNMIYSESGGNIGIGFAIPINTVKSILEQLKTGKKIKRGFIGVQPAVLTDEYAAELGLKGAEGVLVGALVEDGPSKKAGMMVGDVIINVGGKKISSFNDLLDAVEILPIGKAAKVTVFRNKTEVVLFVTVKERP